MLFRVCFGVKAVAKSWRCASGTLEFLVLSQWEGFMMLNPEFNGKMVNHGKPHLCFVAPSIGTLFLGLAKSLSRNSMGLAHRPRSGCQTGTEKMLCWSLGVKNGGCPISYISWLSLPGWFEWLSKIGWCGTMWVWGDHVSKQTYLRHSWIMNDD